MNITWWQIVVTIICLLLSGTFSGLSLGLMSLDQIDLRVLADSGTDMEQWCARKILPVRNRGNFLLCTLLIGNTAVNSALSIVTADLFGGITGFLASTIAILYLGEIIPQALCYRYGLLVGAYAIPLVKFFMIFTSPLSYPTSKVLDLVLGSDPPTRYNKSQLKSLLALHGSEGTSEYSDFTNDAEQGYVRMNFGQHASCICSACEVNNQNSKLENCCEKVQEGKGEQENQLDVSCNGISTTSKGVTSSISELQSVDTSTLECVSLQPSFQTNDNSSNTDIGDPNDARRQADLNPTSSYLVETNVDAEETESRLKKRQAQVLSRLQKVGSSLHRFRRQAYLRHEDSSVSISDQANSGEGKIEKPLTRAELAIVGGAFDFAHKTVQQVMTPLDSVFMLDADCSLDFDTLLVIYQSGRSRIPIYEGCRNNIIGVLYSKDLMLIDPEDALVIRTVVTIFARSLLVVNETASLEAMLSIFKRGGGQLALVQRTECKDTPQERNESLGVCTLEDLVEELIGQEIEDDTDVFARSGRLETGQGKGGVDASVLKIFDPSQTLGKLTEAEVKVIAAYLACNFEEFSSDVVNSQVLLRNLNEALIFDYMNVANENKGILLENAELTISKLDPVLPATLNVENSASCYIPEYSTHAEVSDISQMQAAFPTSSIPISRDDIPIAEFAEGTFANPHSIGRPLNSHNPVLLQRKVPCQEAYLVISGKVNIAAGDEGFASIAGRWTLLAVKALTDSLYAPDFTARVCERPARVLCIERRLYQRMVSQSEKARGTRLIQ